MIILLFQIITVVNHKIKSQINMRSVALLFFGIHLAFAGTHSYQYFNTVVYRNSRIPEITAVGMVDDEQFMYFDSNTMKAVPKTEWIRQNEGADYWNTETAQSISIFKKYENDMHYIMDLFNQSMSGVHIFQMMYGCEQDDDGTTRGHLQFGYNGEDLVTFDMNTHSYIAVNPQADIIKNKWEADRDKVKNWKIYLENICIEMLKKFVSYKGPERKVAPQVSLLQKNSTSPVVCHATSFYPKTITMTWKKNNEDQYEDVEISDTLPNADGTYQKSIILSVKPEEWKKNPDEYKCVIQHVEAEKEIVVLLNENNIKSNSASDNFVVKLLVFITIAIAVGCLLAAAVFAAKKWRKSRAAESSNSTGYMQGSTTDSALQVTDESLQNVIRAS